MSIIIFGAGGHGTVVADILRMRASAGEIELTPVGFGDDDSQLWDQEVAGLPVRGTADALNGFEHSGVIIAIGDNRRRAEFYAKIQASDERLISSIHPDAVVADGVRVGEGSMICAGSVVNTESVIDDDVIINTGVTVDHHNLIGSHAHIAPGANLGGSVTVGEGALIGIGAIVLPGLTVGEWAVVGAGAVVTKDVDALDRVAGVPARSLRRSS